MWVTLNWESWCIDCYVVTANCSVEVLAYSYWSIGRSCTQTVGHVKVNGAVVWQGSSCTNFCNPYGVNTLLIDPFSCSVLQSRRFDTWYLSNAATELSNYLQTLNNGSVIVGVTAHNPADKLSSALSTLRQFGVNVADVQGGGSFAFIAQKGNPVKTVLRKVLTNTESRTSPARFNAVITGTQGRIFTQNKCKNLPVLGKIIYTRSLWTAWRESLPKIAEMDVEMK